MKKALLIITTLALIIGTLMQTMPVGANPTDDPKTKITLTVSPETISPGETVKLTISEENTGNAAITNVRVEVTGGAVFTLTSNNGTNPPGTVFSGDNSNDGILFPSEKWTWVVPFMAGTENYFTATGHGDYTYFDWSTRKYVTVDITPKPDPSNPLNTLYPDETDTKTVTLSLTASLGDFVWYDVNANGIQDAGEPGVPGVKVELYNGSPAPIRTTTTDINGKYLFSDLLPGNYSVKFYLPPSYIFTLRDKGLNDKADSDADIGSGETTTTNLSSGENDLSWDAGLYKSGGVLLPTNTSVQMYASGKWPDMYDAFNYVLKFGKISSVSPGVLFYYDTILLDGSASIVEVVENNSQSWKPFDVHQNQAYLYDKNFSKIKTGLSSGSGSSPYSVKFNVIGLSPGKYYIGIKYSPKNLEGQSPSGVSSEYKWLTKIESIYQAGSSDSIWVYPK